MDAGTVPRFHAALPRVREWIRKLLQDHAERSRSIGSLGFVRLSACFRPELLEQVKVVCVDRVPFPPLDELGLPELVQLQPTALDGITLEDTIFLRRGHESERLCFHELVHIVQWSRLGPDRFLLAYGLGLLSYGYACSPLEQIAYALQDQFERGILPPGIVRRIERVADEAWEALPR